MLMVRLVRVYFRIGNLLDMVWDEIVWMVFWVVVVVYEVVEIVSVVVIGLYGVGVVGVIVSKLLLGWMLILGYGSE